MTHISKSTYLTVFSGFSALLFAGPAAAYLGPGAGLGMIGSLVAIVVVALIVLLGLVVYPIRMLRKKRRERAAAGADQPSN